MNKKDFVKEVAKRSELSEYAINEIYNVSYELIAETLIRGENVEISKIGTFVLNTKKAKNLFGENKGVLKVCVYPSFRISDRLKSRVKDGYKYKKVS